jgi:hypothetical protein
LGPTSLEALSVGDVIVFGLGEDLLAHRYWGVSNRQGNKHLISRGDRLAYYDPPTPAGHLRAVVIGRRRDGRLLNLSSGRGAWLNARLSQLSALEAHVVGLQPSHYGPGLTLAGL